MVKSLAECDSKVHSKASRKNKKETKMEIQEFKIESNKVFLFVFIV